MTLSARRPRASRTGRRSSRSSPGCRPGSCSTATAIDADLRRRQQGYGRSPRQQIETDEVEVLAGLRHGRTLGTPLALVVRNRDHANWTWGMSPWPPEGEPPARARSRSRCRAPVTPTSPASLKYGLDDVARRARARERAADGGRRSRPAPSRRRCSAEIGDRGRRARSSTRRRCERADRRGARRARHASAASSRCGARGVPPGLGSYATQGRPARRAARRGADGHPGGEGRRDRRRLRARRAARLARRTTRSSRRARPHRETNRAGGIEARRLERRGDRRRAPR